MKILTRRWGGGEGERGSLSAVPRVLLWYYALPPVHYVISI